MKKNSVNRALLVVSIVGGGAPSFIATAAPAADSPNFLIIMTDQQRWDALAAAGNDKIITPNLDRLAAEGTMFSQAVSPCPVSGPSRTSMLTGYLIENSGVVSNLNSDRDLDCKYESYDQILAKNGYTTEYYGKFHSPQNMACEYQNPPEYGMTPPESIKKWEIMYNYYLASKEVYKGVNHQEGHFYDFSFYGGILYEPNPMDRRYGNMPKMSIDEEILKKRNLTQPDHHGTLLLDDELTITALQAQQTIDALKRLKDKKFALSCSFHSPHSPILPTKSYVDMYDVDDMPIPASIGDQMENSPYKGGNGRLTATEYADGRKIQYMTRDYYALVSEIDHWVGEIFKTLDELELSDNTVVVFLSDHGEMLGSHGMREKNNFFEESVRVPLIVKNPLLKSHKSVVETPVSCLNIFATILDIAGIDSSSDGVSLTPHMTGKKFKDDFAIAEWNWKQNGVPNLMIRSQKWKYMVSSKSAEHTGDALFDLENDPYEMNNLLTDISNPAVKKVVKEQLQKLINHLEERDYPRIGELHAKLSSLK